MKPLILIFLEINSLFLVNKKLCKIFNESELLTEHRLKFLSLKGGCTGLFESIHVRIPHCWKSHVAAHVVYHVHLLFLLSNCGLIPPMTRDVVWETLNYRLPLLLLV